MIRGSIFPVCQGQTERCSVTPEEMADFPLAVDIHHIRWYLELIDFLRKLLFRDLDKFRTKETGGKKYYLFSLLYHQYADAWVLRSAICA